MIQRAVTASRFALLLFLLAAVGFYASCARLPRRFDSTKIQSPPAGSEDRGPYKLNINTASAMELEKLPGVGKVLAERIIAYREQFGPLRRVEHLMIVRGISDRKFREIQFLLTVE